MIRTLEQIQADLKRGVTYKDYEEKEKESKKEKESNVDEHGIKNVYETKIVKQHMGTKLRNPGYDDHKISVNFNCLIVAASGGGKTQTLCNFLERFSGTFNQCYIFTQENEPIYDAIKNSMGIPEKALTVCYGGYRAFVQEINRQKKSGDLFIGQSVVVFDDMCTEKDQNLIEKHMSFGRKRSQQDGQGCCTFYLTQSYGDTPVFVRKQATLIVITRMSDYRAITEMIKRYASDLTKRKIINMYEYCCDTYGHFLLIDTKAPPDKKYRKCFDEYLNPDDFDYIN